MPINSAENNFEDAIAADPEAPARSPGSATAHYDLGKVYRADGELGEAEKYFRGVLDSDPGHAGAMAALGEVLQEMARDQEAIPFLKQATVLMPDDADLHCDLGDALQTLGQLTSASAAYERSLHLNPKLSRAWYSAGCAQASRKEYAGAIGCFRRALEIRPEWPPAQHNLGRVLFQLGQVEEALDLFREAAEKADPALPQSAIAVIIPGSPASDNQAILDARRTWAECQLPTRRTTAGRSHHAKTADRQLRIGYVSSFFQDHNWMKPVWASLITTIGCVSRFTSSRMRPRPVSGMGIAFTHTTASTTRANFRTRRFPNESSRRRSTCSST